MVNILAAGTPAPDFSLHTTPDQKVSLSDFRGRPVILAFYPADWSPVCGDQMALYNELLGEFHQFGAELLGISVDSSWCHIAFAHDRKLRFPLMSDFEPKGQVARMYRAYRDDDGTSERWRRCDSMELLFARGRQSWRRRHSAGARSAEAGGRAWLTTKSRG